MADVPLPLNGQRPGVRPGGTAGAGARWTVTVVYSLLLIVLAVIPSPAPYVAPGVSDSVLHAAGYGVLALLVAWTVQPSLARMTTAGFAGAAWGVGLGIVTELLQGLIPWRDAELRDVGSDLVGALVGAGLWLALSWLSARRAGSAG